MMVIAALLAATLLRYAGLAFVPVAAALVWRARGWRWGLATAACALPVLAWFAVPILIGGRLVGGSTTDLSEITFTAATLALLLVLRRLKW